MLSRKKGAPASHPHPHSNTIDNDIINSHNNNTHNNAEADDDDDHKSTKRRSASPATPRHRRSFMECCRLRILRSRRYWTQRCVTWTLIVASLVYLVFFWVPAPWPLPGVVNPHGLTLFHVLRTRPTGILKATSGKALLQHATYLPRPLMMGSVMMLLPDDLQQQLDQEQSRPPHDPTKSKLPRYELLEANIDYQDMTVQGASLHEGGREIKKWLRKHKAKIRKYDKQHQRAHHEFAVNDLNWKFDAVFVRDMGNGLAIQREIRHNSKDYQRFKPDPYSQGCEPQYEWMTQSFPNCNSIHEQDLEIKVRQIGPHDEPEARLLASGGYRDVWYVEHTDLPDHIPTDVLAMKTLLYKHPWSERNYDRHRRDALATDRLTRSPYALSIHAFCGNTGVYEFANGGSLEDLVDHRITYSNQVPFEQWNSTYKIHLALQVARAVADIHNIDQEGRASMAHTDISMSQFVSTDRGKTFRVNDFNRARFLYRDQNLRMLNCPFEVASNKGKFRAPEEYAYLGETEKVDVYSMGNVLYVLLTGKYPFDDVDKNESKKLVKQGVRPTIPDDYWYSQDKYVQAMLEAIRRCWVQQAGMRAGARSVEVYLKNAIATQGKTVRVPKIEEIAKMKREREEHLKALAEAKAKSDSNEGGAQGEGGEVEQKGAGGGGGRGQTEAEHVQHGGEGAAKHQEPEQVPADGVRGDLEVGGTAMTDAHGAGGGEEQQQQQQQQQPAAAAAAAAAHAGEGEGEGDREVGGTEMTDEQGGGGGEQKQQPQAQQQAAANGPGEGDGEVGGTEMTEEQGRGGGEQNQLPQGQQQAAADGAGEGDREVGGTEMTEENAAG